MQVFASVGSSTCKPVACLASGCVKLSDGKGPPRDSEPGANRTKVVASAAEAGLPRQNTAAKTQIVIQTRIAPEKPRARGDVELDKKTFWNNCALTFKEGDKTELMLTSGSGYVATNPPT